ncbi:MAG TPA: aldo/keto reductase [Candidatus Sulfomarinibacteraceae bacterium]|nr:aldo/keto reductase [Candidatus Sulfomarinibacteraceae bacterium]
MMRYQLLGKSGLRVSELALGTMTFGTDWNWGADRETSSKIFDAYAEAGGNFVDTSNNYTNGTSERFVGEFIAKERDRFVVATKYTLCLQTGNRRNFNEGGNSRKSMMRSVENSLRRLNTEYIDVLYLHMWDFMTPVEEVLRGMDDLVRAGKVLYAGFSDTPAWVIAQATALAHCHGWSPPVVAQVPYSFARRDPERAILPMARTLGLAVAAWGVLGGGVYTGKYNGESDAPKRYANASEQAKSVAASVVEMAGELGCTPAQLAINWAKQQANVIPIVGARTEAQMLENLGALDFTLTAAQLTRLSNLNPYSNGFPLDFLTNEEVRELIFGESYDYLDIASPALASLA